MLKVSGALLARAVGLVTFMAGSLAIAAENGTSKESGLEEVVVTAQKREQNQQETPLAISTFDA